MFIIFLFMKLEFKSVALYDNLNLVIMPILKFWKIYELIFDMLKINIEYIFKDKFQKI